MKGQDIAILAGIGIVGYGLLQSDFFKGLGKVGTGVGTAAEGLGGGVADLSAAIGSVGGDVAELTSFVGEFGNWTAQQFTELQQNSLRENTQADVIDRASFEQTQNQLTDIQSSRDVSLAEGGSERSLRWDTFKTDAQDNVLDFFVADGNNTQNSNIPAPTGLISFNPLNSVMNFIRNIGSPSITGAVVKDEGSSSSTSSTSSTSSGSSSSSSSSKTSSLKPVTLTTRNKFMELLGYQGQTTATGVVYTKPTFSWSSFLRK